LCVCPYVNRKPSPGKESRGEDGQQNGGFRNRERKKPGGKGSVRHYFGVY